MLTKARDEKELVGLVYSLTERPKEHHLPFYAKPLNIGIFVLLMVTVLNIIFW